MIKFVVSVILLLSSFTAFAASSLSEVAVANASRPADDKKADANRHPRELLDFSKAKADDTVVDLMPGRGYFTRLFASVVGPKGHVIAYVPKEFENAPFKPVDAAKKAAEGLKNVEVKVTPLLTAPAENVSRLSLWSGDRCTSFRC